MIDLMFGGDAMLGRGVNAVINDKGPAYPLAAIAPITGSADLFFANLECAISPEELRYSGPPKAFYYRADPHAVETLLGAGVDLVSLANNHALDADFQGLHDTLRILKQRQIRCVGAGVNPESARQPVVIGSKGMDIGGLAYCDHQKDFAAGVGRPGISYVDLSLNETVVGILNEVSDLAQDCHHVVVAFHWMPNWVSSIPTFYRDLGRKLVHAGASVVWGHSPHHILGVEWVDRSVILFSTGGLVDDYAVDPQFRNDRSLLFRVSLGEEAVESVTGLPIELKFARTEPASDEVWDWTAERLESACLEVGSEAVRRGDWLEIQPQD